MDINQTETRDGINKAQNRFLKCVLDKPTGRQIRDADRTSPQPAHSAPRGDNHCSETLRERYQWLHTEASENLVEMDNS